MSIYQRIYDNLCIRGKDRKHQYGYNSGLHRHRIIPGHQNGTYDDNNCTYLTPREHVIAHFLLWKLNQNPQDLRSMHMLSAKLTLKQRRIVGVWCYENGIGLHNKKWDAYRDEWNRKGILSQKASGKKDTFYYWSTPEGRKERASLGGKASWVSGNNKKFAYWASPEGRKLRSSRGGLAMKGRIAMHRPNESSFKRINPEDVNKFLDMGYVFGTPKRKSMYLPGTSTFERVLPENVDDFLAKGYIFGIPSRKIMHKPGDNSFKRIKPEDVDKFLKIGYVIGKP